MYTRYFGLTEAPFAISPNPRYLYMSELHREALAHLMYGITSDGCMILLTGDIGTGKTTLCRSLLEQLPPRTEVAVILNPRLTARELLKTVCEELNILSNVGTATIKTYIDAINQYLLQAYAEDRTVALIIDEAQNLDLSVLEQVRLLTNLETNTRKLLRILLIGQPELRNILERPELVQVNQRITSRYHLAPLEPADVRNYIQHRLNVAGDNGTALFTEKAIRHAIDLTDGIPRLINVLCDRALLGAYAVNADHVDLEIMKRAGEEIFPKKYLARRRRIKAAAFAATALTLMTVPALVFIPDWLGTGTELQTLPVAEIKTEAPQKPEAGTQQARQEGIVESSGMAATKDSIPEATEKASPPVAEMAVDASGGTVEITDPSEEEPSAPAIAENITLDTSAGATPATLAADPLVVDGSPIASTADAAPRTTPGSAPFTATPVTEEPVNTIKVSAPLIVQEKAGSKPGETVEKLIRR